jgi:ABC-type Mn2+/Zn2+ transport system ATPase subunit
MADDLFALESAAIGYGRPLLSGISLAIGRGEYWGIFGPNGAGKTTLIKTLLGVLKPLSGTLQRAEGIRLGYVPQLSAVRESLPLSVREVVELGALGLHDTMPVREALARVDLADRERSPFRDLSGGQRQRAMVARALHRRPDVLVLDEPTNGIDLITRHALMSLFHDLNHEGMTVLLVTHLLAEIGPEVDRFLWLDSREGLCLAGPREEVLGDPRLAAAYGAGLKILDVAGEPVLTWVSNGEARHG